MILYTFVSSLINGIAVAVFGLITWLHNPKNKVNKLMGLLCLSVSLWGFFWVFEALAKEESDALILTRFLDFSAIFIPILFLHWVLSLLNIEERRFNKIILSIGYFLTLFFAIFAFTPYFISIKPKPYFYYYAEPGILHPFFLVLCYFGLVGYAFYLLFKHQKIAKGYKKAQIRYVLLGSLIGFGGGATNYFLFYDISIPPFGNPLVAVGFGIFTYAIIRYRLMDIKIIIGKGIAYAFSFFTIIISALLLVYFNVQLTRPLPDNAVILIIAILSILLFQLHRFYEKVTEQYFSRNFFNAKIKITDLEERLTQILELETFSYLISNTLKKVFNLEKIAILIKKEKNYEIQENEEFNKKRLQSLIKSSVFISVLEKSKKILTKEDKELKDLKKDLKNLGIEICLPLSFKKELIGILILGNKKSQNAFSNQDLKLLNHLLRQAAIALKNASLFAEINKRKKDLEVFYKLVVNRELYIKKLEQKIKELKSKN